jgi:hypothetical protein
VVPLPKKTFDLDVPGTVVRLGPDAVPWPARARAGPGRWILAHQGSWAGGGPDQSVRRSRATVTGPA